MHTYTEHICAVYPTLPLNWQKQWLMRCVGFFSYATIELLCVGTACVETKGIVDTVLSEHVSSLSKFKLLLTYLSRVSDVVLHMLIVCLFSPSLFFIYSQPHFRALRTRIASIQTASPGTSEIAAFSMLLPQVPIIVHNDENPAPHAYSEFVHGAPVLGWIGPHEAQYDPVMFASVIASAVRSEKPAYGVVCIRRQDQYYDAITYHLQAAGVRPQPLPVPGQAARLNQMWALSNNIVLPSIVIIVLAVNTAVHCLLLLI